MSKNVIKVMCVKTFPYLQIYFSKISLFANYNNKTDYETSVDFN